MKKIGLGRGLRALIPVEEEEKIVYISIDKILPNPDQPRRDFSEESLQELASSIKEKGILQPILVKKIGENYQVIAGERRFKAALKAGIEKIPAIIKDLDKKNALELSLIENIQREDLNPIETALAYKKLKDEFQYTQEEIAKRLGKSRSEIANTLRLLNLSREIQEGLLKNFITEGHARALLGLEENLREKVYRKILERNLSVRMTEKIVRRLQKKKERKKEDIYILDIEEKLQIALGTKVSIVQKGERGYLKIHFYSNEDLERILEKILRY